MCLCNCALFTAAATALCGAVFVKGRIASIEILAVKLILSDSESIAITVNMKYYIFHVISMLSSLALIFEIKISTTAILSLTESSSHLSI